MEILINTPGQTFYYSTIEGMLSCCEEKSKCAVIVSHADVQNLIEKLENKLEACINQLIVVAEDVNDVTDKLGEKHLLTVSAVDVKDAIQIALNSSAICKNVICVSSNESSKSFTDMVEQVIV